MGIEACAS